MTALQIDGGRALLARAPVRRERICRHTASSDSTLGYLHFFNVERELMDCQLDLLELGPPPAFKLLRLQGTFLWTSVKPAPDVDESRSEKSDHNFGQTRLTRTSQILSALSASVELWIYWNALHGCHAGPILKRGPAAGLTLACNLSQYKCSFPARETCPEKTTACVPTEQPTPVMEMLPAVGTCLGQDRRMVLAFRTRRADGEYPAGATPARHRQLTRIALLLIVARSRRDMLAAESWEQLEHRRQCIAWHQWYSDVVRPLPHVGRVR
ncbi:uncharacterized protein BXZ73DRAFT_78743 [Epithele typhae]|uniref:uncharacterized protein n=1 Tax=Epithele typhae TaxID=378194 RepID=UPI002008D901|nr:uncharacterized protein BXZ73DRAFT_78743 [Epithele typhae]KAH9926664.1 hypothetical protein BXZ73DRAFT_78743 [Epithele typhae]